MHLAAAVEHDLQQPFEFVDIADRGQRGVLADGVTAGDRTLDERALLAHLGHLPGAHRRHRDLGELRQEQHTIGVVVVHAAGDQTGLVVAHHVQHREARVSRVNWSAVSHTLRAALDRARTLMPMPLCWMPWPGKP